MNYLFSVVFLITSIVFSPLWYWSFKKKILSFINIVYPFIPLFFWMLLAFFGVGAQSLSNLIEIPIIVASSWFGYLFITMSKKNHTYKMIIMFVIIMLLTLALRLLMPVIPE